MTREASDVDPVLGALGCLPEYDVSRERTRRLRERCQSAIAEHTTRSEGSPWTGIAYPALLGTWGAAYLFATLWRFAQSLAR